MILGRVDASSSLCRGFGESKDLGESQAPPSTKQEPQAQPAVPMSGTMGSEVWDPLFQQTVIHQLARSTLLSARKLNYYARFFDGDCASSKISD